MFTDKKFVVIHDEDTARVSGNVHNVNVETSDFKEIENITLPDVGGSAVRRDIRVPLLAEYIEICKKYEKICVLEVKNHFDFADLEKMVEEISALGYIENVIFISFDFENCTNLRKMLPNNKIQWLTGKEISEETADMLRENNLDLDIHYKKLSKESIDVLHSKGIKINCWTCDSAEDAQRLASFGVDFITTNILENK